MTSHVEEVLNLWKQPFLGERNDINPYPHSEQLKKLAGLFSPGPHYHYILDLPNLHMEYVSEGTREVLGIPPEKVNLELLIERLVPEEREAMAKKEAVVIDFFCNYLAPEEVSSYKSSYFCSIRDINDKPHKICHQAIPLTLTDNYQPKHVMVVQTDVSHLILNYNNSLNFQNLGKGKSYFNVPYADGVFKPNATQEIQLEPFEAFTEREIEVIRKIAEGLKTGEIAEQMHISIHTLRTHRRNILAKSGYKNIHELVAQCLLAGVI